MINTVLPARKNKNFFHRLSLNKHILCINLQQTGTGIKIYFSEEIGATSAVFIR
jgi:hypothetical protein